MRNRKLRVILSSVVALGGALGIAAMLTKGTNRTQPTQPAVRYMAEAELPKDETAERRRLMLTGAIPIDRPVRCSYNRWSVEGEVSGSG
jgi:hypothetical protein